MIGVIDRFEEEFAVVEIENRKIINILKTKLPKKSKEGDVLIITEKNITIDYDETKKRQEEIEKLAKELFE